VKDFDFDKVKPVFLIAISDPILHGNNIPKNINRNKTEEYIRDCIAERQFEKDSNDFKILEESSLYGFLNSHCRYKKAESMRIPFERDG
jgi:hypothetical protein